MPKTPSPAAQGGEDRRHGDEDHGEAGVPVAGQLPQHHGRDHPMAETTPWRSKCQYSATLRAPGLPSQDRAAAPRICRASLPLVRASVYFRNTQ
jgi:hypothetical protein